MASGQPDYTRQVAVTVFDTPDPVTVNVSTTSGGVQWIDGRTASFEDTSFVTGDSPVVHDVNAALGRNAHDGYIVNDGAGDLQYQISNDGITYGGAHTLKQDEPVKLTGLDIDSIKITWVANCGYRIMVV
jgi:hypothetical protein